MAIPGALSVEIHDSDPELGEIYEFAFYMLPPYSDEAFMQKRDEMGKRWIAEHKRRGLKLTTRILVLGPFNFSDPERRLLDSKWLGQQEYILQAWFKRERPRIVPADVIEMWHERRRQFGFETHDPTSSKHDPRTPGKRFELENDWVDKNPVEIEVAK